MKKTILTFVILFCASILFAQSSKFSGYSSGNNPHDSLLFDGAPAVFINKGGDKHCKWKVKHVWGTVIGTKDSSYTVQPSECDDMKEEFVRERSKEIRGKLKDGDEVYDDDNLEMEGSSFIQLETNINDVINSRSIPYKEEQIHENPFNNPFIIITAQCKNFKVPSCGVKPSENYGNGYTGWDKDPLGDWYFNRTPGAAKYGRKYLFQSSGPKYNIHTDQCIIKNNGTKYSLEQTETEDIIKVYEGSVEVQLSKFDDTELKQQGDDVKKLYEDYQNGKITLEEFMAKSKENTGKINKESADATKKVVVEAGYQCTVEKKIGDPVSIPADDDKWWDK
jgi:hypothetical protein